MMLALSVALALAPMAYAGGRLSNAFSGNFLQRPVFSHSGPTPTTNEGRLRPFHFFSRSTPNPTDAVQNVQTAEPGLAPATPLNSTHR